MRVQRMNRVELLLPGADIPDAVRVFNEVLGGHLNEPEDLPGVNVRASIDFSLGIEVFGPIDDTSAAAKAFLTKPRRGAVGPLVFEVEDLDACRTEVEALGFRIVYEYGTPGSRQLHLDAEQLFGFGVTFTDRKGETLSPPSTRVRNFQRVELLVDGNEIESARETFTTLLGASFSPIRHIQPHDILTCTDERVGLELLAPASPSSATYQQLKAKGRGGIGPIVWFVDDLDAVRRDVEALGYRVHFEFGAPGARQVHLDPSQLYGFGFTFTERRPGEHL